MHELNKQAKNNTHFDWWSDPNSWAFTQDFLQQLSLYYSWPIPPAQELAEYEEIIPWSAQQIMNEANREAEHRRECEKIFLSTQAKKINKGQNYWLASVWMWFSASILLWILGFGTAAWAVGVTTVLWLAWIFVLWKFSSEKQKALEEEGGD